MALQSSGKISLSNVNSELNLATNTRRSLGQTATRNLFGIASGRIKLSNGYGKSNSFTFNKIILTNTQNYNLRSDAIAAGWDGVVVLNATVTVNAGIYVWSDSTATAGFDTGSIPVGSTIIIINNGYIIGKGGNGVYRANGTDGGPAMNISYPVSITNNSYIAGGGGGGGSTGGVNVNYYIASGGGGAGGGEGGSGIEAGTGGAGGTPGQAGTAGVYYTATNIGWCGGGGGGRILPGVGGPATVITSGFGTTRKEGAPGGGAGGAGGVGNLVGSSSPGGAGGSANNPGTPGIFTGAGIGFIAGGGGGGWGASGGNSAGNLTGVNYTSAGAGGKAVNLNGNTVTWIATGTRWGAIS